MGEYKKGDRLCLYATSMIEDFIIKDVNEYGKYVIGLEEDDESNIEMTEEEIEHYFWKLLDRRE